MESARRKSLSFVARILGAALFAILLAEGVLRLFPTLLPESYLAGFPGRGIEFFHPGVLGETPIGALPLPLGRAYSGPPPGDLQALGLAPSTDQADRTKHAWLRFPADARGLPNERALDQAHVLLIGDSFLVSASIEEPIGLQHRLSSTLGRTIYNLGVSGIGPRHEFWLMEEVGMALEPELVLWFFFAGNDLDDERALLELEAEGVETHADRPGHRGLPRLRTLSLVQALAESGVSETDASLPGFALRSPIGTGPPLWFLPAYVWQLGLDQDQWKEHPGWPGTRASLVHAHTLAREGGARFVLVYLPSKAQVYWPYVEHDPELLRRFLEWGVDTPLELDPAAVLEQTLANRNELESLLASFCADQGIPFFSARPVFEERARRGELVFLTTDSHWDGDGQAALAPPLAEFIDSL